MTIRLLMDIECIKYNTHIIYSTILLKLFYSALPSSFKIYMHHLNFIQSQCPEGFPPAYHTQHQRVFDFFFVSSAFKLVSMPYLCVPTLFDLK